MASPKLFREWAPRVTTRKYDQSQKPPVEKTGLTLGMGMTEKQGGTDVRANTTKAERAGSGFYRLTGHKWFMSAPMSDAFLVLAQAGEGLSAFLVPRHSRRRHRQRLPLPAPEGQARQPLQRFLRGRVRQRHRRDGRRARSRREDHHGHGDADPARLRGRVVRRSCAPALPKPSTTTRHRQVFGKNLVDQPLMQRVLADMALDVAARPRCRSGWRAPSTRRRRIEARRPLPAR